MKNTFRFLGIVMLIAAIGFSMTSCPGNNGGGGGGGVTVTVDPTDGRLTIGNLGGHNGRRVIALGWNNYEDIVAAQSVSGQGIFTGGIVADGSVTLNVWSVEDVDDYTFNLRDFNTSGEFLIGMTIVFSGRTSLGEGEMDAVADYVEGYGPAPDWLEAVGIGGTVTFTNGVGSLTGGPPFWW